MGARAHCWQFHTGLARRCAETGPAGRRRCARRRGDARVAERDRRRLTPRVVVECWGHPARHRSWVAGSHAVDTPRGPAPYPPRDSVWIRGNRLRRVSAGLARGGLHRPRVGDLPRDRACRCGRELEGGGDWGRSPRCDWRTHRRGAFDLRRSARAPDWCHRREASGSGTRVALSTRRARPALRAHGPHRCGPMAMRGGQACWTLKPRVHAAGTRRRFLQRTGDEGLLHSSEGMTPPH